MIIDYDDAAGIILFSFVFLFFFFYFSFFAFFCRYRVGQMIDSPTQGAAQADGDVADESCRPSRVRVNDCVRRREADEIEQRRWRRYNWHGTQTRNG